MITSIARAEDEEKFAHPSGQDSYGTTYQVKEVPSDMTVALDAQGRFTLPWFINATINVDEQECWVIEQVPEPGTVLTCPQTVTVQLKHTCGNDEQLWARLPIHLVDATPPEIQVLMDSTSQPQVSFGGVQRYLSPVVIAPIITVSDSCDQSPQTEYVLNGEPFELGTVLTEPGLYILNVSTNDAWDNWAHQSIIFEIRAHPSLTAAAVVQETDCEIDPGGQTGSIRARNLISAANFDHQHVLLSSLRVLLRTAGGSYLNVAPIPIKSAFLPGCNVFQHLAADARIDDCVIDVVIEAEFAGDPVGECPAELVIVGVGVVDGEVAFEWGAVAANAADPAALQTLLPMVGKSEPCGDPHPPGPPLPPECELIETLIENSTFCANPPTGWGAGAPPCKTGSGTSSILRASGSLSGASLSAAYAPFSGTCSTNSMCGGTGMLVLIEQLVGNCCNCSIGISVAGTVKVAAQARGFATAWGSFTAFASSSGGYAFLAPCGSFPITFVMASAAASDAGSTVPNPDVSSATFPFSCVEDSCTAIMFIATQGHVQSEATASHFYAHGIADANVSGTFSRTVSATATPCGPDPCADP